ncbi:MAG: DUF1801 domain-containing protein [Phycisphaerae bacterium]
MQSKATTVEQYLAELPPDRRAALSAVREVILDSLDNDFEEGMQYGMIGYYVPHRVYPAGYHCNPKQPLPFAGLASQKNHMAIYLMSVYGDGEHWNWFREAWARTGKKLDMGKCCIRFRRVEDLALDVIADAICRTPAGAYIAYYERAILSMNKQAAARAAKQASPTRAATQPVTAKRASPQPTSRRATAGQRASQSAAASASRGARKRAGRSAAASPRGRSAAKRGSANSGARNARSKRARTPRR